MSVLRRAKLRTPDGIESIEYPLGVEAENVEVANQENLSQRLVRIDEDLEKNEEDIAAVSELAGTNKQNIGAAEVRIDALERRSASVDKKPYYFNTVADMKAYQKLIEGDMVITLGYYNANDGGGAEYKIVNGSYINDGGNYHKLNNGFFAELIIKGNKINVKQFGAKGDGITDDTAFIQHALNNGGTIIIPYGTYMIDAVVRLSCISNTNIIIQEKAVLQAIPNNSGSYAILQIVECNNISISGGHFNGDLLGHIGTTGQAGHGIKIRNGKGIYLDNIEISNC